MPGPTRASRMHLLSSSFFSVSVLPCCSALSQPVLLHVGSALLSISFLRLPQSLNAGFHLEELLRASMDQCDNTFLFFLSLTVCFFDFLPLSSSAQTTAAQS